MQNLTLNEFKADMKFTTSNKSSVVVFNTRSWINDLSDTEKVAIAVGCGDTDHLAWMLCNLIFYICEQNPTMQLIELCELIHSEALSQVHIYEMELHTNYESMKGEDIDAWVDEDSQRIKQAIHKFLEYTLMDIVEALRVLIAKGRKELPHLKSIEFNLLTLTPEQKAIQLTFF